MHVLGLRQLCWHIGRDGVKAGRGQGPAGTGIFRVNARRGPGQEVYNERFYTVVWLNNLQPAKMELVSRCNFKRFHQKRSSIAGTVLSTIDF